MITNCLQSFHKDRSDSNALAICECQVRMLDKRFTYQQYKKHMQGRMIDIEGLLNEDSAAHKQMQDCFINSGKTMLIQAESFEQTFMDSCIAGIKRNTNKQLDITNVQNFCSCQLNLIKEKKITDEEFKALDNPNSVLFYEMIYKCGDPFANKEDIGKNWSKDVNKDVVGPQTDTINILSLNGMTYIKMKTGSMIQFWLFDTGASDLLINSDMEKTLQQEGMLTQDNYLGTGEYEMANGAVDTCRKYLVQKIQIGKLTVNNVIMAVTDKGKHIIAGKALLNKFTNWKLDNEKDQLIINK
jgi:hypothetical protein